MKKKRSKERPDEAGSLRDLESRRTGGVSSGRSNLGGGGGGGNTSPTPRAKVAFKVDTAPAEEESNHLQWRVTTAIGVLRRKGTTSTEEEVRSGESGVPGAKSGSHGKGAGTPRTFIMFLQSLRSAKLRVAKGWAGFISSRPQLRAWMQNILLAVLAREVWAMPMWLCFVLEPSLDTTLRNLNVLDALSNTCYTLMKIVSMLESTATLAEEERKKGRLRQDAPRGGRRSGGTSGTGEDGVPGGGGGSSSKDRSKNEGGDEDGQEDAQEEEPFFPMSPTSFWQMSPRRGGGLSSGESGTMKESEAKKGRRAFWRLRWLLFSWITSATCSSTVSALFSPSHPGPNS